MISIEFLIEKLSKLKVERAKIDNEILVLEKQIGNLKKSSRFEHIRTNKDFRDLFGYYLMEIKNLSQFSIRSYYAALDRMKELLQDQLGIIVPVDFYFIDDIKAMEELKDIFESSADLWQINLACHHWISASYNNYINFLIKMEEINR